MYSVEVSSRSLWGSNEQARCDTIELARCEVKHIMRVGAWVRSGLSERYIPPHNISSIHIFPLCSECNGKRAHTDHDGLCCTCHIGKGGKPYQGQYPNLDGHVGCMVEQKAVVTKRPWWRF